MPPTDCPPSEELTDYALGKLPDDRSEAVAAHLDTCDRCKETLTGCADWNDPLVASLRAARADDPFVAESGCREALALVEAIGRDSASGASDPGEPDAAKLPDLGRLGHYRLLAKLGQGGMGTVYKALHTRLDKVVALKVLPAERMLDAVAVARFKREMKAAGTLDHPNIVRAFDAGELDNTHFLVMEYIEGIDLSTLAKRTGPLPVAEACELVRQAAIGLQHIHEHGLVHRDVKPSNVMLTSAGRVKILDMGLALLDPLRISEAGELTSTGQMMGTLDYMAPEQGSDSHQVDVRADVYSLGATAYRLLCGEPPFGGQKYDTPMKKLVALGTESVPPILKKRSDLPEELVAVIHRMLAREPAGRFATPGEVARALEPFASRPDLSGLLERAGLHREPLDAASKASTDDFPSSALASTRSDDEALPAAARALWWRRPMPPTTAVGLAILAVGFLLVAGIVITIIKDGRETAVRIPDGSDAEVTAEGDLRVELPDTGATPQPKLIAALAGHVGAVRALALSPDGKRLASSGDDGTIRAWRIGGGPMPSAWEVRADDVRDLVFSPDGRTLASACGDGSIELRSADTGEVLHQLAEHTEAVTSVAFAPDGKTLASAGADHTIRLWDLKTAEARKTLDTHTGPVLSVAISPDGKTLASSALDGRVMIWDLPQGKERITLGGRDQPDYSVAFSEDGKFLAAASIEHTVQLWRTDTWEKGPMVRSRCEEVQQVEFSPDGGLLATAGPGNSVALWDTWTGEKRWSLDGHANTVHCAVFSPDGTTVASAGADSSIRLWQIPAREPIDLVRQIDPRRDGSGGPWHVEDGALVVDDSATARSSLRILYTPPAEYRLELDVTRTSGNSGLMIGLTAGDRHCQLVAAWPLGEKRAISGLEPIDGLEFTDGHSSNETAREGLTFTNGKPAAIVCTVRSGHIVAHWESQKFVDWQGDFSRLSALPNTDLLHVLSLEGSGSGWRFTRLRLVPLSGKGRVVPPPPTGEANAVADDVKVALRQTLQGHSILVNYLGFSPDGKTLASASPHELLLTDGSTGELRGEFRSGPHLFCLGFSPDGKTLATGDSATPIRTWHVPTCEPALTFDAARGHCTSLAYAPDGKTLAAVGRGETIRLWDPATGRPFRQITVPGEELSHVVFASDGSALAAAGVTGVGSFNAVTGAKRYHRKAHRGLITGLALSPDGNTLASASRDRTIKLWDMDTGEVRLTLEGYRSLSSWSKCLAWSPGDTILASANCDGTITLWNAETGEIRSEFRAHHATWCVAFSPDGKTLASGGSDRSVKLWDVSP